MNIVFRRAPRLISVRIGQSTLKKTRDSIFLLKMGCCYILDSTGIVNVLNVELLKIDYTLILFAVFVFGHPAICVMDEVYQHFQSTTCEIQVRYK